MDPLASILAHVDYIVNLEKSPKGIGGQIRKMLKEEATEIDLIHYLMEMELLESQKFCEKCGKKMTLRRRAANLEWRCRKAKIDCSSRSIKTNSFFTRCKLTLRTSLEFLLFFADSDGPLAVCKMSPATAIDMKNSFRELCLMKSATYEPIGGEVDVVEVTLSFFQTPANGKQVVWAIGGISRLTSKVFVEKVDQMSSEGLLKILQKRVHPGSTLITNSPEHSETFGKYFQNYYDVKNGITDFVHVATMDAFWGKIHEMKKKTNGTGFHFEQYVSEAVVRQNEADFFECLLGEIKKFVR